MVVKDAFIRMDGKEVYFIENANKTYTIAVAEKKNGKTAIVEKQGFEKKAEAKKAFESHKSKIIDAGEVGNGIDVFLFSSVAGFLVSVVDAAGKEIERKFSKIENPTRKTFEQYKNFAW